MALMNPVLGLYELGYTPGDVKELVVETLSPYFRNIELLNSVDVGFLGVTAVNVGMISTDPEQEKILSLAVKHGWNALDKNESDSLTACSFWEPLIQQAMNEFWSLLQLEHRKDDLPLDDFRVEIFRNVGSMIEACLKPAMGHLLSQIHVAQGKSEPWLRISQLDLGVLVNELHRDFGFPEMTAPSPWGLRLSQWRNIAQHHSSETRGDLIVAKVTKSRNDREVTLSRADLLVLARRISDTLKSLNTSRLIYMHENGEKLTHSQGSGSLRHEALKLQFSAAAATQGFQVDEVEVSDVKARVHIRDLMDKDWMPRFVHSSQFLCYLWELFRRDNLEICYALRDGTNRAKSSITAADIQLCLESPNPVEALAMAVKFELDATDRGSEAPA